MCRHRFVEQTRYYQLGEGRGEGKIGLGIKKCQLLYKNKNIYRIK